MISPDLFLNQFRSDSNQISPISRIIDFKFIQFITFSLKQLLVSET